MVGISKIHRFAFAFAILALSLFILSGCGKLTKDEPGSSSSSGNTPYNFAGKTVYFDSSVPGDQASRLRADLEAAQTLNMPSTEASLFGLSDMSAASMTNWLGTRFKIVTGENFDYASLTQVVNSSLTYVPTIISDSEEALGKVTTIMFNLGSYIYLTGKEEGELKRLNVVGTTLEVKSPRVGIFQIGEGLFTVNRLKSADLDALVNRIIRLGTLYHEARHDDGNGTNAGFPHAKCTSGTYKDHYACENNLNGPYALEAAYLRSAYYACYTCSAAEKEGLKLFITDSESRIMKSTAQTRDARAESIP